MPSRPIPAPARPASPPPPASPAFSHALLDWYDRHARALPWRVPPGADERADPYRVWVSEIMLQQTGAKVVAPRFVRFVARWPTVVDLADAHVDEVVGEWAGLGYYSRARNIHACARVVVEGRGGAFPRTAAGLRELPGIGDYTSAAIAAIAFGEPVPVVDGNVERIASRILTLDRPPKAAARAVRDAVAAWVPADRPGDFAQATMDLGATICTPRSPACLHCPVAAHCRARAAGEPERWPVKAAKAARPSRLGAAFVARRPDGAVLLTRRPPRGLLGGTASVPMSDWSSRADGATGAEAAPFAADWRRVGTARHGFTHFDIALEVWTATATREAPDGCWWSTDVEADGVTTLLRRVLEASG